MTEKIREFINWGWLGPILFGLVVSLGAAWAMKLEARVTRVEELYVQTIREMSDIKVSMATIVEQNRSQDTITVAILRRLDSLTDMHTINGERRSAK